MLTAITLKLYLHSMHFLVLVSCLLGSTSFYWHAGRESKRYSLSWSVGWKPVCLLHGLSVRQLTLEELILYQLQSHFGHMTLLATLQKKPPEYMHILVIPERKYPCAFLLYCTCSCKTNTVQGINLHLLSPSHFTTSHFIYLASHNFRLVMLYLSSFGFHVFHVFRVLQYGLKATYYG